MDQEKSKEEIKSEQREDYDYWMKHAMPWKAYMNWYSWGSPTGLGLFFISIAVVILILHYAGLIH
jgi:hypothetical protein